MRGLIPVASRKQLHNPYIHLLSRKQLHNPYLHLLRCKAIFYMSHQLYYWWQSILGGAMSFIFILRYIIYIYTLSMRKLALVYVSLGLPDTKLSTERKYYFKLCQNIKSKSIFNKIFNDHSHISYTNWNPSFIKISINYEFKAIQQNETELIVQLWIIMDVFQTES